MALGLGLGIQFYRKLGGSISEFLTWGKSTPARFWGTETPEYWGGLDAQAEEHYNRVIADGGIVPAGLGGVNSFFQVVKNIYATADITTAISAAYDPQYLGYKLGAGSGTTLGQAAQKLYSCSGASGDVVQTTAASQPLLLTHEGANYWQGPNVTNNAVSTPDAPANRITLDLEIIAYVKHTNNTTLNSLVSKNDGGTQRGYSLVFDANNLVLYYGLASLNVASSTATIASGSTLWVRCTRNATTGQIQFFTSTNPANTNPQSVTWTQLGATISGIIGPINSSGTLPLLIGGYISVNSGFGSLEKIYRLTLSNSIEGAPVVDFNPQLYNAATSQTQWAASTGEVWTINTGTAAGGYKGVLVNRTIVQSDGIDDRLLTPNIDLTTTDKISVFSGIRRLGLQTSVIYDLGLVTNRTSLVVNFSGVYQPFNLNGGLMNEYQTPSNSTLLAFTHTIDRSLPAVDEQQIYYNNILQLKTAVSANNTSGNFSNGPIAMFSRTDGIAPNNSIINSLIVTVGISDTAQRLAMFNTLKTMNRL